MSGDVGPRFEVEVLDVDDERALAACFRVFTFLRPHLTEEAFGERVRAQTKQGYRIVYVERDGVIAAAAGYRFGANLAWGKFLYIDDLITHPEHTRVGLGGALLDWLLAQGKRHACDEVHLDTGYQRHDAHRLYLNKGFVLSSHHMRAKLD